MVELRLTYANLIKQKLKIDDSSHCKLHAVTLLLFLLSSFGLKLLMIFKLDLLLLSDEAHCKIW